jgi:hypothetical protein
LAKFEDLYSANTDRQAAGKGPTGATVDGIRVPHMRADAISHGQPMMRALHGFTSPPANHSA